MLWHPIALALCNHREQNRDREGREEGEFPVLNIYQPSSCVFHRAEDLFVCCLPARVCKALWRAALNMLPEASFDGQSTSSLSFFVPSVRTKSVYSHITQACPKLSVMNQRLTVQMCAPCNLTQHHPQKSVSESQTENGGGDIGELSDFCGSDGNGASWLQEQPGGFPSLQGICTAEAQPLEKHLWGCVCTFIHGAATRAG